MSKLIRTAAAVATAIVGVTFTGCSSSSGGGGDIATVNDQHISKADFDKRLESSPTAKQVLTQMVQQALIDQYGKDQKIDIAPGDIEKKEADIKAKYPPGQFEAILKQQGLTETDVQNILRQQLIIEKAVAPMVHVTDADIKAYFDKNHATLDKPAQVRARHILVADQKHRRHGRSQAESRRQFRRPRQAILDRSLDQGQGRRARVLRRGPDGEAVLRRRVLASRSARSRRR